MEISNYDKLDDETLRNMIMSFNKPYIKLMEKHKQRFNTQIIAGKIPPLRLEEEKKTEIKIIDETESD